jgi:hypothetical protein
VFYGPLIINLFKKKLEERKCLPASPAIVHTGERELELRGLQKRKRNIVAAIEAGQGIDSLVDRLKEIELAERRLLRQGADTEQSPSQARVPKNGAAEALFEELLADLPEIISGRPFAHPAKLALRAALTNRQDWWAHKAL